MSARRKCRLCNGFFSKFPTQRNREFQRPNREFFAPIRETFRVEQGSRPLAHLCNRRTRFLPETSSIRGHRKDRSLVQRRSFLAAPEICSAVTRTPRWSRQVCGCRRVGPGARTLLFRPPDIAYPYCLGPQAPPALAQDIRPQRRAM